MWNGVTIPKLNQLVQLSERTSTNQLLSEVPPNQSEQPEDLTIICLTYSNYFDGSEISNPYSAEFLKIY